MPAGRPTKLTKKVIDILKQVAEDSIYLTDEDLLFLLNEKLEPEERIATPTFKAYKGGTRQGNSPLMKEFVYYIKKALINEKKALLKELKKGEGQWQSKAWILERKFAEWNLKKISEIEHSGKIETEDLSKLSNDDLIKRAEAIRTISKNEKK
jgi:hypothetical protein